MQSRTWGWSSNAREEADQARREDDEYWSGPTYYQGAYERNAWGEDWDPEQEDKYSSRHQERQRAARKEARREAKRKKRDMDTPPRDPFNHYPEASNTKTAKRNEEQETWEKAKKDERCNDGSKTKSPSPQEPDPNWSERVREKKEKKEQAARRKAERELSRRNWPAELLLLLSEIIAIQGDIEKTQDKVDALRRAMKVHVPQSVCFLYDNGKTCLGTTKRASALSRFQNMVLQHYLVSLYECPLSSLCL